MLRHRVCRVSDVPMGQMRGFDVPGFDVPVLVANVDGVMHATTSVCTHDDVSLLGGVVDAGCIVCPGHAYEFDLASGRCVRGEAPALYRFQTAVVDGDVYISLA